MSTLSKILVFLQFLCLIYLALLTDVFVNGPWLILQIGAISLCIWALIIMKPGRFNVQPEVKENADLISKGPYQIIRNPMYLGLTVFFAVTVMKDPQLIHLFILLLLFIVFLLKILLEEKYLALKFGKEYEIYKERTYRLIPYFF